MTKKKLNFSLGQYVIWDVWGQPPNITGWAYNSCSTTSYTSYCYGQTIIGGYGAFGVNSYAYKTYYGLPGHNSLTIQWDAYYVDKGVQRFFTCRF